VLRIPCLLRGALYFNNALYGLTPSLIGIGALLSFFPLWVYSQNERLRLVTKEKASPNGDMEPE